MARPVNVSASLRTSCADGMERPIRNTDCTWQCSSNPEIALKCAVRTPGRPANRSSSSL